MNNNNTTAQLELDKDNNKKYKLKAIHDSEIYAKKLDSSHLLGFYNLVFWKSYLKEKKTRS